MAIFCFLSIFFNILYKSLLLHKMTANEMTAEKYGSSYEFIREREKQNSKINTIKDALQLKPKKI